MEFRILGPLHVAGADGPIAVDAGKVRAVLEFLLLHANEVIPTDRLVDSLWGDDPPESAEHAIEVYVSRLRRALGADRIETRAPGYRIRIEPGELDLHRFEALTAEAIQSLNANEPSEAVRLFREAEGLWRGPALADLRSSDRTRAEITRLDELRLAETEARIDAMLATGRHAELVPELDQLVAEHPFRERVLAQRMLALYRSGRQVDALEAFHKARRALDEDLGLEPGPGLQQLQLAILRQDPALDASSSANPAPPPEAAAQLPTPARRRFRGAYVVVGVFTVSVAVLAGVIGVRQLGSDVSPSASPLAGSLEALDPAQRDLRERVPLRIRDGCQASPAGESLPRSAASVTCPIEGLARSVTYDSFDDPGLVTLAFSDIGRAVGAPAGSCERAPSATGPWQEGTSIGGTVLCYQDNGASRLVWTYETKIGSGLMARAWRQDDDWSSLYDWWLGVRAFIRH